MVCMSRGARNPSLSQTVGALVALTWLNASSASTAATLTTLYSFCAETNCADGSQPLSGLLKDPFGDLFGTTAAGGKYGWGTVFELVPSKSAWQHRVIWNFHQWDGSKPVGTLIRDTAGNLYGTAAAGGAHANGGVAFELMPDAGRRVWKRRILYNFCAQGGVDCTDGEWPQSGLTYAAAGSGGTYDGTSPLYGTTYQGGANGYNDGVLFKLVPKHTRWKETVGFNFCDQDYCTNGASPFSAPPAFDAAGNIFGTLNSGGTTQDNGIVYELTTRTGGRWKETELYNFCIVRPNCSDGTSPSTGVIIDALGNMYGTTPAGGPTYPSYGVVYELADVGGTWQQSVLHTFCSLTDCMDGSTPEASLVRDGSDNLYGTTQYGGGNDIDGSGNGGGVLFEITAGAEVVLYSFCAQANCADGKYPMAPLVIDQTGNLFGTASEGGAHGVYGGGGTVFEVTP